MFLHNLKYELLSTLRHPAVIFWLMLFPIFLGTVFKIGFGSIYEKDTLFSSIPTAVVETADNSIFREVVDAVSGDDSPLLKTTYTDEDTALEMLRSGEVKGIIHSGDKVTLTVKNSGIEQSILKSFIEQYGVYETIIKDTLENDPANAQKVIAALSADVKACTEKPVTQGNTDQFAQYFYNLIAMVAIFGSETGLHITKDNQANMSSLGARRNISPTPKSVSLSASLIGCFIAQAVCMVICVTFVVFVLKIDLGSDLLLVYASAILGGCLGVTMGFLIGSIAKVSADAKDAISMSVSMVFCFLSGLFISNIKGIIADTVPWVNSINPVAIISDCFYCLNLYNDYTRYGVKMISMAIYIVLFSALGVILTRRKKYASI